VLLPSPAGVYAGARALTGETDVRKAGASEVPVVPGRLLFSALSAAALAQPTKCPSNHERGQEECDDQADAGEHIDENNSGAVADGHDARSRLASMPL